jgi:hypothetical protein
VHLQYVDFADAAIQDNVAASSPVLIRRWRPVGPWPPFKAAFASDHDPRHRCARIILSEIGRVMSRFQRGTCCVVGGLYPRNDETAGKRQPRV